MSKLFFLCIVLTVLNISCVDISESTLKLVHVFFRHGSRIPDEHEIYPTNPYKGLYTDKFGQLTNRGKSEAYQLGKILRARYNDFLGESFHTNMVFIKSTDVERTKMTALLVLAGLFPPYNTDKWSDELHWLPIPITYSNYEEDYELVRPTEYCPTYMKELNDALNTKEALETLKTYNKTFEILSNNTGKTYKTLRDVFLFHQVFTTEQYMNLTQPLWAVNQFKSIQYLTNMQTYFENYNTILRRLSGGRMLTNVIKNIKEKILNSLEPKERKIFLYSGHDFTVINILFSLHFFNVSFPNFNAAVIIELHQHHQSEEHFVKVLYLNDVRSEPKTLFLKECGYECNFTQFQELVAPHLPLNYTKECESNKILD